MNATGPGRPTGPAARRPSDAWVHLPPIELLAAVQLQPTPDIPLASIRELLRPVHDEHGQLVDWLLFASGFEHHDAVADYLRWRNTWRRHWPIGPIDNVASLRDTIADIEHDLDRELDALLDAVVTASGRAVVVPAERATGLLDELATVRLALSVDDRTGVGIVDDMPAASRGAGLARTWLPPTPEQGETLLTGTPASAVVLRPGAGTSGLAVLHGGPPHESFDAVAAVDLRGETAVVLNERGSSLRLDLHEARPLAWLVPRSLRWHIRTVPLLAVWSMLFDGLGDALRTAVSSGEPVVITGEIGVA
jgi:hypothetical protein